MESILDYSVEVDEAEDEKKEDRKANLNSARVFLYQGVRRFFLQQIMVFLWKGEEECNKNMKTFIDCIDAVRGKWRAQSI